MSGHGSSRGREGSLAPAPVFAVGPFVAPRRGRSGAVCVVATAVALVTAALGIVSGEYPMSFRDLVATLLGHGTGDVDFVVWSLRIPRAVTAAGVGAALGVSGAVFQSLTRNPLGSPDILGFESGAALGAVALITTGVQSSAWVAGGAVAGGLATAALVYLVAWRRGVRAERLVLVGIGVGVTAAAGVDYLLTRSDLDDVERAVVWLTGSLNGRSWSHAATVWAALAVTLPLVGWAQRRLDRLELGDDVASELGTSVERSRALLVVMGVALASLAVAAAGPVVFVAFVAGPVARRLAHHGGACLVPSAFVGATIVLVADLAARRLLAPTELPVGILTAAAGAPALLWLLARHSRGGSL